MNQEEATSKKKGRFLTILVAGLLLASAGLSIYVLRHHMWSARPHERGASSLPHHVLIATQGSRFKNSLTEALVAQLEVKPVYVRVIDVSALSTVDANEWQVIVIMHTWEVGRAPRVVREFVARHAGTDKIIDVTTSGSGREKLPGVDVISSASVIEDVSSLAVRLGAQIDSRLARL